MKRAHLELGTGLNQLNPLKNFKLPEELIDGYELYVKLKSEEKRSDRKVTLIGRPLSNGNVSLYFYAFADGRKKLQSAEAVLIPERNAEDKNKNKAILRQKRLECEKLAVTLKDGNTTFNPTPRKSKKILFEDYVRNIDGFKPSLHSLINALSLHIHQYNASLRLADVDDEVIKDFISYIKNRAVSLRSTKGNAPRLSANTQFNLVVALSMVLRKAVIDKMLASNPMDNVTSAERPSRESDRRGYLTPNEVARLMQTPYPCNHTKDYKADTPTAFLFSCFAGLRVSDIIRLTGENVGKDENGTYICFKVKKTGKYQTLYLNDLALQYLPHHKDKKQVLFDLPNNKSLNCDIKKWCKEAGINKEVSFHVARHTCATMELSAGVPLAEVSDQLGHSSIRITEVYAKVMRDTQRKATNKMADYFKQQTQG